MNSIKFMSYINNKMNKVKEIKELESSSSPLELLSLEPEPLELLSLEQQYLDQLNPHEKTAYLIAKNHLLSSFSLKKSIGFSKWKLTICPSS